MPLGRLACRLAFLVAILAGCAPTGSPARPDAMVELKDFSVRSALPSVSAGEVVLGLNNAGPTVHELVVARTDRPAYDLPLDSDGLSVSEEGNQLEVVGELEQVQLGEEHDLSVDLSPGHYVLFCNLEGHYLGGMYADLEVTP